MKPADRPSENLSNLQASLRKLVGQHGAKTDDLPRDTQEWLRARDCIDEKGAMRYEVAEANGCLFLVDPLKPELKPGEEAVYSFHDEATELLRIAEERGETFDMVVDSFSGGGHSMIPILSHHVARQGRAHDINPRAIALAKMNAELNGIENRADFVAGDTRTAVRKGSGKTLFIANAPFALATKGIELEVMRDGGENGLKLASAYLENALKAAKTGDVIIGVAYSRMRLDGSIELDEMLKTLCEGQGIHQVELMKGRRLWRNWKGLKEQENPMPLTALETKVAPENEAGRAAYRAATALHESQGWDRLGYFEYRIQVDKKAGAIEQTRERVARTL